MIDTPRVIKFIFCRTLVVRSEYLFRTYDQSTTEDKFYGCNNVSRIVETQVGSFRFQRSKLYIHASVKNYYLLV